MTAKVTRLRPTRATEPRERVVRAARQVEDIPPPEPAVPVKRREPCGTCAKMRALLKKMVGLGQS